MRGKPLIEDPVFAARLAQIEMELDAMATTNLRLLSSPDSVANAGPDELDAEDQGHGNPPGAQ